MVARFRRWGGGGDRWGDRDGRHGDGSFGAVRAVGIVERWGYDYLVTQLLNLVNLFSVF